MTRPAEYRAYEYAMHVLASHDPQDFERLRQLDDDFPHGVDGLLGRSWIRNAVDSGSVEAVRWMLELDVDVGVEDEDGYTPLHAAVERDLAHRHEILDLLLRAGAPPDALGPGGATPVRLAAEQGDADALQLFADHAYAHVARTDANEAVPLREAKRH